MKKFGELSVEEQNELFQEVLRGGMVVFSTDGKTPEGFWTPILKNTFFNKDYFYKKQITYPWIDKVALNSTFKWLCKTEHGNLVITSAKPTLGKLCSSAQAKTYQDVWIFSEQAYYISEVLARHMYGLGTCDWKDSLIFIEDIL